MSADKISRREVLRWAGKSAIAVGMGAAFPAILAGSVRGQDAPGERLRIGSIGVGNQGKGNLKAFMKHVVAVCDVDKSHLDEAKAMVEKANGGTCAAYSDYRKLLEDKSIDAVVVTTPDHWHALVTVDACSAGKDVYCEKPLSLTIAEGRAMVQAARHNKRIVQTGSQQRSDKNFHLACELVRGGYLGKIKTVKVGIPGVNFKGPSVPNSDPPAELDYDFWLGPTPKKPYNEKHVHYNFRFFWDYSGGQMTNWGAHHIDIAHWGLGMDASGPLSAEATARFNKDGWFEVPEWNKITYQYPDGVVLLCGQDYKMGTTFEGEKGTIYVNRGHIESDPADILTQTLKEDRLYVSANHHTNWLESIKSRKLPICDVEIGHRSATACHLGNLAVRTGRKLNWDAEKERIVGDEEANKMLSRPYRAPWHNPEVS